MSTSTIEYILKREIGSNRNHHKSSCLFDHRALITHRIDSIRLSRIQTVSSKVNKFGVFCMDIDRNDNRFILCGSCNGAISIVDLCSNSASSSTIIHPIVAMLPSGSRSSHSHRHMIVACQWYPHDSGMFVTASSDKTLKIWDTNRMKQIESFSFECAPRHQHWSPISDRSGNSLIAVATGTTNIELIDLRSGSSLQHLRFKRSPINVVQWSAIDEYLLMSGSDAGDVTLWDIRRARNQLKSLKCESNANGRAHTGMIKSIKFSDDGLLLMTFGNDRMLRIWDGRNLSELRHATFPLQQQCRIVAQLMQCDITTDGIDRLTVFMPCEDNILLLQPFERRQRLLNGHYNNVNACVYRRDYQQLFSAGSDRLMLVWSPEMDEPVLEEANQEALMRDTWSDDDDD